jgi:hypothetical protein
MLVEDKVEGFSKRRLVTVSGAIADSAPGLLLSRDDRDL